MPSPGQVLRHKHFRFTDGTYGEKLLVVLNTADLDAPCLVLKTRSNFERYPGCVQGCNANRKVFLVPRTWQTCFSLDTYVQLEEIFPLPTIELLQGSIAKDITFLDDSLSPECFEQLLNCLRHFKDDILESHWNLILNENKRKRK